MAFDLDSPTVQTISVQSGLATAYPGENPIHVVSVPRDFGVGDERITSSTEVMIKPGHCGTHIDGLAHIYSGPELRKMLATNMVPHNFPAAENVNGPAGVLDFTALLEEGSFEITAEMFRTALERADIPFQSPLPIIMLKTSEQCRYCLTEAEQQAALEAAQGMVETPKIRAALEKLLRGTFHETRFAKALIEDFMRRALLDFRYLPWAYIGEEVADLLVQNQCPGLVTDGPSVQAKPTKGKPARLVEGAHGIMLTGDMVEGVRRGTAIVEIVDLTRVGAGRGEVRTFTNSPLGDSTTAFRDWIAVERMLYQPETA